MRKKAIFLWLILLFAGIAVLFWGNEWKYSLPTPVPATYKVVSPGAKVNLASWWAPGGSKPIFLHFFNPHCPCSRFNIPHVKSLVKQYGQEINFAIVVMTDKNYTVKEIQDKFGLDVPVFFDSSMAAACGVYSTPQAVIIDTSGKLYYRGNYNRSRYCSDKKTEYARIALEDFLDNKPFSVSDQAALQAYGCQLPTCTK